MRLEVFSNGKKHRESRDAEEGIHAVGIVYSTQPNNPAHTKSNSTQNNNTKKHSLYNTANKHSKAK